MVGNAGPAEGADVIQFNFMGIGISICTLYEGSRKIRTDVHKPGPIC